MTLSHILEDQCFNRWITGARMAGTFREHCLLYFQPNMTATNFLSAAEEKLGSDAPYEIYMAVLRAEREIFEKYDDTEANKVLQEWKQVKGIT